MRFHMRFRSLFSLIIVISDGLFAPHGDFVQLGLLVKYQYTLFPEFNIFTGDLVSLRKISSCAMALIAVIGHVVTSGCWQSVLGLRHTFIVLV